MYAWKCDVKHTWSVFETFFAHVLIVVGFFAIHIQLLSVHLSNRFQMRVQVFGRAIPLPSVVYLWRLQLQLPFASHSKFIVIFLLGKIKLALRSQL